MAHSEVVLRLCCCGYQLGGSDASGFASRDRRLTRTLDSSPAPSADAERGGKIYLHNSHDLSRFEKKNNSRSDRADSQDPRTVCT